MLVPLVLLSYDISAVMRHMTTADHEAEAALGRM